MDARTLSFGEWVFLGLFQAAGGHHSKGIFRKRVAPHITVRFAAEQTVMTGMGLAVADPRLALGVAAAALQDKTERGSRRALETSQRSIEQEIGTSTERPICEKVAKPIFGWFYDVDRPISALMSEKGSRLMTSAGLYGLGWGLLRAADVKPCFRAAKTAHEAISPEPFGWQKYDDFLGTCLQLCEDWQRRGGTPVRFPEP
jgi:hypothetical protein